MKNYRILSHCNSALELETGITLLQYDLKLAKEAGAGRGRTENIIARIKAMRRKLTNLAQ